ncbi:uncharacterized protein LOC115255396 [Aedes albopictus]|uniref:Uncharacterized protein n=1 Tax=Aedes albopictus TaxID=7160 RepID=A0ABM1ZS38_AEDAL
MEHSNGSSSTRKDRIMQRLKLLEEHHRQRMAHYEEESRRSRLEYERKLGEIEQAAKVAARRIELKYRAKRKAKIDNYSREDVGEERLTVQRSLNDKTLANPICLPSMQFDGTGSDRYNLTSFIQPNISPHSTVVADDDAVVQHPEVAREITIDLVANQILPVPMVENGMFRSKEQPTSLQPVVDVRNQENLDSLVSSFQQRLTDVNNLSLCVNVAPQPCKVDESLLGREEILQRYDGKAMSPYSLPTQVNKADWLIRHGLCRSGSRREIVFIRLISPPTVISSGDDIGTVSCGSYRDDRDQLRSISDKGFDPGGVHPNVYNYVVCRVS